jgi:hypothetical protein
MKFLDPDDPFFRSPVVRWLTVLIPVSWAGVEFFVMGAPVWAALFLGAGGYAAYMLFLRRKG